MRLRTLDEVWGRFGLLALGLKYGVPFYEESARAFSELELRVSGDLASREASNMPHDFV